AEVAEIHVRNAVVAHELAEREQALAPVQARVHQNGVVSAAIRAVLTDERQKVRIVGERICNGDGSECDNGCTRERSRATPGPGGSDRCDNADPGQHRHRIAKADIETRGKQHRAEDEYSEYWQAQG